MFTSVFARAVSAALLSIILIGDAQGQGQTQVAASHAIGPKRSLASEDSWLQSQEVGSSILFYVEASEIGKEFLIWRRYPSSPLASRDHQVARWQTDGNSISLEALASYKGSSVPLEGGGRVIAKFDILSSRGSKKVIDISPLFNSGRIQWELADSDHDPGGMQVEYVSSFRDNTVVSMVGPLAPASGRVAWNFVRLPEEKMTVRLHDRRFGFDYPARIFNSSPRSREGKEPILRWRLNNPTRGGDRVSGSIVVKVDPRTPREWRKSVLEGISSWDEVFRQAGFEDAILGVDPGDSPGFSYDDLRNSVICWPTRSLAPPGAGTCGWLIYDPRSGELLQRQIGGPSRAAESFLGRYVSTMAAVDSRVTAKGTSSVEEIVKAFIKQVSAHEVGHVIGLRDGNFGKYQYSVDQVRSREWVARYGFSPSIMNYTRFNYLAQPEDGMSSDLLVQGMGPADVYSILWGYSESPDAVFDKAVLAKARFPVQGNATNQLLFSFTEPYINTNPADTVDTVEVTDPIAAANLGLTNLRASMRLLGSRNLYQGDADIQELLSPKSLYLSALDQWAYMVTPVATMVGAKIPRPAQDSSDDELVDVPMADQIKALRFLCDQVFSDEPTKLFTNRLKQQAGIQDHQLSEALVGKQTAILHVLFQPGRLSNLTRAELGAMGGESEVGFVEAFSSLRACPFSDEMRRHLALQASNQP